jgi:hypothetical protein
MTVSEVAVEITTTAQPQQTWQNTGTGPQITMNGNPFPQPPGGNPHFSSGVQVVVLDPAMDITSPAAIRSNQYQWLPDVDGSWMTYYQNMWDKVASQILTSGNTSQQIVFVATFGMDVNAAPTSEAIELFLGLGAGPQLQGWWTSVDVGSQSGQWVGFPGNYILIGQPMHGYGEGDEAYQTGGSQPVKTSVTATLTNYGG